MKRHIIKFIIPVLLLAAHLPLFAQGLRSSYFLEGATFRHQMNPAFIGERGYFSFPALGNMNISATGNIGLSDFIYKSANPQYDLTTFMNKSVSRDEFLSGLNKHNIVHADLNMTILSFGFHSGRNAYNTFEIGIRSNSSVNLPYDLFDFMKTGMKEGNTHYNIKDLQVKSYNYADIAIGHAHKINRNLTIGAKIKFLVGLGYLDAKFDEFDLHLSEQEWLVRSKGSLMAGVKGGYFEYKDERGPKGEQEIDGFDVDSPGINGFGVGIDLGATYKMDNLVEGLTLSASLLDLGFISWSDNLKGYSAGEFSFKGFEEFAFEKEDYDMGTSLEDQFDDTVDRLEELVKFYDEGETGSHSTRLATTLNVGAQYVFPFYKKLSFGLLSSTRFNKPTTWTEARLSANVAPLSWIEASANVAVSTYSTSFGWMINFHPKGFNFFVGSDYTSFKVNPWFIPINKLNANVNFGINFTFGGAKKNVFAAK